MTFFPVFLSIVVVLRNQSEHLKEIISSTASTISAMVSDYELIIVDNASSDDSISVLKQLTGENGEPNLQVYALTKEVSTDTAAWVGLENALGDFVAVINPLTDDVGFLSQMLDKAVDGADVVFASNQQHAITGLAYRAAYHTFNTLYEMFNGVHLAKEAPQYRVLNKRVINFILQHPQPAMTYRHLPATGGFARAHLTYSAAVKAYRNTHLIDSIDRGMRLLVSTTRTPMRLVTSLTLFGAITNLLYSLYVVAIALFKADVAPGWTSLSLQQSGMFFLLSLVLMVLGEYILQMVSLSNEGPPYHISQEFTSARLMRREKLNVEEVMQPTLHAKDPVSGRTG